jgi:hypothetical protein
MSGQEEAASRARGLEVTIHDRHSTQPSAVDGSRGVVGVHVASPASSLVVKAPKVCALVADFGKGPDRLKEKDSGDVAMLKMVATEALAPNDRRRCRCCACHRRGSARRRRVAHEALRD